MNNIEDEVNRAVSDLVTRLVDLAYRAARDRLKFAGSAADRSSGSTQIARRDPAEHASLADRFMAHVQAHPGLHIEEISEQLAIARKDLRPLIRGLVGGGRILTRGQGRETTYFASSLSSEPAEYPAPRAQAPRAQAPQVQAPQAPRPVTMPSPPIVDEIERNSGGVDDLCNLASLSRLYDDTEPDPDLGRLLADVLTLSRRLRR